MTLIFGTILLNEESPRFFKKKHLNAKYKIVLLIMKNSYQIPNKSIAKTLELLLLDIKFTQ